MKPGKQHFQRVIKHPQEWHKAASCASDVTCWQEHIFTSVMFLPKLYDLRNSDNEVISAKSKLSNILQNNWFALFRNIEVIADKD